MKAQPVDGDHRKGWDPQLLQSASPVVVEWVECILCFNIARAAVRCGNEHFYCEACVGKLTRCPTCSIKLTDPPTPARLIRQTVGKLMIRCPVSSCHVVCEEAKMEAHLATCPFRRYRCELASCRQEFEARHAEVHQQTCPGRASKCQFCNERVLQCQSEEHKCITCENDGCDVKLSIAMVGSQEHEYVCEWSLVQCQACDKEVPRCMMREHDCFSELKARAETAEREAKELAAKLQNERDIADSLRVELDTMAANHQEIIRETLADAEQVLAIYSRPDEES